MIENKSDVVTDSQDWRDIKQGLSYKEIVLSQVRLCVKNFSQEMRQGFWTYSYPSPDMRAEKQKYFGDTRKELVGSIESLHDLLMPKFDEQMKKSSEELEKAIEEQHNISIKKEKITDTQYWNERLKLFRKLFRELIQFLDRMSWLDMESLEE